MTGPKPLSVMPVTYGRAFGGMYTQESIDPAAAGDFLAHPDNLVARGYARGKFLKLLEDAPAHNVELPTERVTEPEKLYMSASLGPLARNWTPRLSYGGTYDERWQEEVFPLLPADFNERYYQCTPADQPIPYPQSREEITLINLRPHANRESAGVTTFKLPGLSLPMVVLSKNRRPMGLQPVVDTIVIGADAGTYDLTWRASLPLRRSLHEIHTIAAGSVCKRWWKNRVFGLDYCGCGGKETRDEDLAPVTNALED